MSWCEPKRHKFRTVPALGEKLPSGDCLSSNILRVIDTIPKASICLWLSPAQNRRRGDTGESVPPVWPWSALPEAPWKPRGEEQDLCPAGPIISPSPRRSWHMGWLAGAEIGFLCSSTRLGCGLTNPCLVSTLARALVFICRTKLLVWQGSTIEIKAQMFSENLSSGIFSLILLSLER